jgi:hypothetical protein
LVIGSLSHVPSNGVVGAAVGVGRGVLDAAAVGIVVAGATPVADGDGAAVALIGGVEATDVDAGTDDCGGALAHAATRNRHTTPATIFME